MTGSCSGFFAKPECKQMCVYLWTFLFLPVHKTLLFIPPLCLLQQQKVLNFSGSGGGASPDSRRSTKHSWAAAVELEAFCVFIISCSQPLWVWQVFTSAVCTGKRWTHTSFSSTVSKPLFYPTLKNYPTEKNSNSELKLSLFP